MTYPFCDWHECVGERIWYRETFLLNNFTLTLNDQVVVVFYCIVKRSHPKSSHPMEYAFVDVQLYLLGAPQIVQWRNATTTCEHSERFPPRASEYRRFRRARG